MTRTGRRRPVSPQAAVQEAEGRQHSPQYPWRPKAHLQWHAAGYAAAMDEILGVANETAARPGSTAADILRAVVELAVAVHELHAWDGPEPWPG